MCRSTVTAFNDDDGVALAIERLLVRAGTADSLGDERRRASALYEEYGFWCLESRPTSRFVGYCGIRPLVLEGTSEIEIGWHVGKTAWDRGIATEAATAARALAFGRFGLSQLVAIIHPDHVASQRVVEKIGMRHERTTIIDDDYPATVYRAGRSAR